MSQLVKFRVAYSDGRYWVQMNVCEPEGAQRYQYNNARATRSQAHELRQLFVNLRRQGLPINLANWTEV